MGKIERATALGTLKLLTGTYQAAGILEAEEAQRIERVLRDAMARNATLHEFEREDRG